MRRVAPLIVCLPLLILGAPSVTAEGEDRDLWVTRLDLRFRRAADRDSMTLRAEFPPHVIPVSFRPGRDAMSVAIGGVPVISLPPVDERVGLRSKGISRWVYRERRSPARAGIRRFCLDLGAAKLKLKAKRLDLSALRGSSTMPVALALGGTTFAADLDMEERRSGLRFRGPGYVPGASEPPEEVPGEDLSFRIVAEGDCWVWQAKNVVVRTDAEWLALFYEYNGDPPPEPKFPIGPGDDPIPPPPPYLPPPVDFEEEFVAAVFLGERPTDGHSARVRSVKAFPWGVEAGYEETRPGQTCPVNQTTTRPFVIVAIVKSPGQVSFRGTVVTKNCP
ncbi:MAG: protease complex subunit PrcB family protein [Planctomycetota bacterium]|jgi:hypothetical protein